MCKKDVFVACIIFIPLHTVFSQTHVIFGIKGGWDLSTFQVASESGIVSQFTNYSGFHAGVLLTIPVSSYFSIQPELHFSEKGAQRKLVVTKTIPLSTGYNDITFTERSTINPYYLEIPVHFKASFKTGSTQYFVAGVGPYVALGVGGHYRVSYTFDPEQYVNGNYIQKAEGKMELFTKSKMELKTANGLEAGSVEFDEALFHRFDTGISAFIGYEFTHFFVTLGYKAGLYNIDNTSGLDNSSDPESLYNRSFSLSIGYKF